jgi:hypothetical protein
VDWHAKDGDERKREAGPAAVARAEALDREYEEHFRISAALGKFGWATVIDRRIGVTESGRIGSFHQNSEPGDKIVIFEGCSMPFVLRNEGQFYRIVGSCYVDGLMYG